MPDFATRTLLEPSVAQLGRPAPASSLAELAAALAELAAAFMGAQASRRARRQCQAIPPSTTIYCSR